MGKRSSGRKRSKAPKGGTRVNGKARAAASKAARQKTPKAPKAVEREISDAEAWELRYHQSVYEIRALKSALIAAREQVTSLQKVLLEKELEAEKSTQKGVFDRIGLKAGDEVVERDGKFLVISPPAAEKSGPQPGPGGTMDDPGGASGGQEHAGGE